MQTLGTLSELARTARKLIVAGIVVDVDTAKVLCRVQTDGNTTDRLHWLHGEGKQFEVYVRSPRWQENHILYIPLYKRVSTRRLP